MANGFAKPPFSPKARRPQEDGEASFVFGPL
jgi:hypothetical protein